MEKEFATYEIAYELKRLGFNEKCFGFWSVNLLNSSYTELKYGMKLFTNDSVELSDHESNVLAPLWQQVIDWLGVKQIFIELLLNSDFTWSYKVTRRDVNGILGTTLFDYSNSRELARIDAILAAIRVFSLLTPDKSAESKDEVVNCTTCWWNEKRDEQAPCAYCGSSYSEYSQYRSNT